MWLKDFTSEQDNPYRGSPFVLLTHLCYSDTLPDWEYPMHSHENEFELSFVIQGEGRLHVNNEEVKLSPGSVSLTEPGIRHCFSSGPEEKMEYYALRFDAEPADGELQSFFREMGTAVTSAGSFHEYMAATFRLLLDLGMASGGRADTRMQAVCLSLLQIVRLLFENRALTIRTKNDYSMSDVMIYITDHCEEKITLKSLSERFAISSSHLSRLFMEAFHTSPINYLINARMAKATEYLGKTNKPVAEIAKLVGYDNPYYFDKLFVRRMGCTPGEYRESLGSRSLPKESEEIVYQRRDSGESSGESPGGKGNNPGENGESP